MLHHFCFLPEISADLIIVNALVQILFNITYMYLISPDLISMSHYCHEEIPLS